MPFHLVCQSHPTEPAAHYLALVMLEMEQGHNLCYKSHVWRKEFLSVEINSFSFVSIIQQRSTLHKGFKLMFLAEIINGQARSSFKRKNSVNSNKCVSIDLYFHKSQRFGINDVDISISKRGLCAQAVEEAKPLCVPSCALCQHLIKAADTHKHTHTKNITSIKRHTDGCHGLL